MADTFVKKPKLIVGTQAQIESEMGADDIGFVTDVEFYTTKQIDELLEKSGGASLPILMPMWSDHVINDISWLRANTFSWHSGDVYKAAYEHLANEFHTTVQFYAWENSKETIIYTTAETPSVGDPVYNADGVQKDTVVSVSGSALTTTGAYSGTDWVRASGNDFSKDASKTDTIDGTTITYYVAQDGHKICLPDQEANIIHVHNRTGYANYYILDTANKQFKLPRKQKRKLVLSFKEDNAQNLWYKLYSDGWVEQGGFFADNFGGSYEFAFPITMADTNYTLTTGAGCPNVGGMHGKDYITSRTTGGFVYTNGSLSNNFVNNNFSWQVSGYANPALVPSSLLELEYYYVGNFEQTAIEQTAGINTETFNSKADRNLMNTTDNVDFVIESQLPTELNGYTWYKKYKSGWVEQGGSPIGNSSTVYTGTLPVEMADTNYSLVVQFNVTSSGTGGYSAGWATKTTTGFTTRGYGAGNSTVNTPNWYVAGMAA